MFTMIPKYLNAFFEKLEKFQQKPNILTNSFNMNKIAILNFSVHFTTQKKKNKIK